MVRLIILYVTLAALVLPARAQKIETQKPDRNRIVHVQTALNHLTVIEVGEPVTTVAAGSSAFKIEWRDNKVFIQPTEQTGATNLFIWTRSGRLNYELEPAGSVEQMDFAIDQAPPQTVPAPVASAKPSSSSASGEITPDTLLGGRPIRVGNWKEPKNRVVVLLKDVFQRENEVFVRYAVRNGSRETYGLSTPQVFAVRVQGPPQWLYGWSNSQLTDTAVAHLKSQGQTPLEVLGGDVRSARVEPGQETVGVVAVKIPKTSSLTVLRLIFPADGTDQPAATLVL
jgi:hypothetical protein